MKYLVSGAFTVLSVSLMAGVLVFWVGLHIDTQDFQLFRYASGVFMFALLFEGYVTGRIVLSEWVDEDL